MKRRPHRDETIEVAIDQLAQGGDGVGRDDEGRVVFVAGALPGERVRGRVVQDKGSWRRAKPTQWLERAEDRVDPVCAHAEACGGCALWHTTSQRARALKAEAAAQTVARIGRVELPAPRVLASPRERGWRVRATFRIERGRLGFLEQGSRKLAPLDACLVCDERIWSAGREVARALGDVSAAEVFCETASLDSAVVTVREVRAPKRALRGLDQRIARLVGESAGVRGVRWRVGRSWSEAGDPRVDLGEVMAHPPAGWTEPVRSGLFRQANPEVNVMLSEHVAEQVASASSRRIVEFFSGCGNLTFAVAGRTDRPIRAYEVARPAVRLGRRLSEHRGGDVEFHEGDLTRGDVGALLVGADVVVLDPPRAGARHVCEALAKWGGARIVYVSCDAATFARDASILGEGGWQVLEWALWDMFPRTAHMEVSAVFGRP
ncbi:MAG: TRAM domain-containing protein [Myxococcota bacterium]